MVPRACLRTCGWVLSSQHRQGVHATRRTFSKGGREREKKRESKRNRKEEREREIEGERDRNAQEDKGRGTQKEKTRGSRVVSTPSPASLRRPLHGPGAGSRSAWWTPGVVWCLSCPSEGAPFLRNLWALRFLVVRETWLLGPVSLRMHASPRRLQLIHSHYRVTWVIGCLIFMGHFSTLNPKPWCLWAFSANQPYN